MFIKKRCKWSNCNLHNRKRDRRSTDWHVETYQKRYAKLNKARNKKAKENNNNGENKKKETSNERQNHHSKKRIEIYILKSDVSYIKMYIISG